MNPKIKHWFKILEGNYDYIYFGILLITFIIIGFNRIGLLDDGTLFFWDNLTNQTFRDRARLFGSGILKMPMYLLLQTGFTNFDILAVIQGFWYYFVTLILLLLTYINIPKHQKNTFDLVFGAYIFCLYVSGTFITSESFLLAGLYWLMFIIILFEDFSAISYKKMFLLLFCFLIMLRVYEWAFVFAAVLVFLLGIKMKTLKLDNNAKTFLIISIFLALSVILLTDFSGSLERAYHHNVLHFYNVLKFSAISFVIIIIGATIKVPYLSTVFTILAVPVIVTIFVHNNVFYTGSRGRILNFFVPLVLSGFMFLYYYKKININFRFLKILNFVLLIMFVSTMIPFSIKWDNHLDELYMRLQLESELVQPIERDEGTLFTLPWLSLIIQHESGKINNLVTLRTNTTLETPIPEIFIYHRDITKSVETLPDLSRWGVVYSEELFERIRRNQARRAQLEESRS